MASKIGLLNALYCTLLCATETPLSKYSLPYILSLLEQTARPKFPYIPGHSRAKTELQKFKHLGLTVEVLPKQYWAAYLVGQVWPR